jgi:8-oxo-dGTP pyrophosphatase MutT (NUDIX family)
MTWRPDLTVAAVVEREGRFLLVEERVRGATVFNQPAGHVEDRESILDAAVRETFEETAWRFQPQHLLGTYLWRNADNGRSTLRVAIIGEVRDFDPRHVLDRDIVAAHWLTPAELALRRHRSPLVLRCIEDWRAGRRFSLEALQFLEAPALPATGRQPT